ncbi:MAG: acyl-CoA dehydrogenase [SAR202 cluster bacterium]|nr:acyl-CoA dehydrogenase [SAR202 cluster bacterium]
MDFKLSPQLQEVVDRAEKVGRECLGPRAAQVDAEGKHPVEGWRDVWKNGLLAMSAPKEYGGLGLDVLGTTMVLEKLAIGCPNTAISFNMHTVVLRYIGALGSHEQKKRYFSEVVDHGKLIGSWGSEPGRHGGAGMVQTTIERVKGGYVINGLKHFCTMAGACQYAMIHCNFKNPKNERQILMAVIPTNTPGVTLSGDWNVMGMRGTISPVATFKDCFVQEDWVLGKPGEAEEPHVGVGQSFGIGDAAVYLGIAESALEYAKEYVKTHKYDPDPAPMSHSPIIQRHIAEMALAVQGAQLVMYHSASRFFDVDLINRSIMGARAKYLATEAALMVTSRALQACGGRLAHKRYPLERHFRDARTGTLMPPNPDRCLEIAGRAELGHYEMLQTLRHSS